MKLATWNVNSLRVRLPQLLEWLASATPDVVCLQETKLEDHAFPAAAIADAGYQVVYAGQKTYNGVAILSRTPALDVCTSFAAQPDQQQRFIAASIAGVRVVCAYVPNGQAVGSDKYAYKLAWLDAFARHLATELAAHPQLAVLGDYNIAPEDRDVHDPAQWAGQILCSEAERAAFRRLLELGLSDAFRLFDQADNSFSWWDYRAAGFRRNLGLRIDHILVSPALAASCARCVIDREPRRWERPSDHAPVLAEFTG